MLAKFSKAVAQTSHVAQEVDGHVAFARGEAEPEPIAFSATGALVMQIAMFLAYVEGVIVCVRLGRAMCVCRSRVRSLPRLR